MKYNDRFYIWSVPMVAYHVRALPDKRQLAEMSIGQILDLIEILKMTEARAILNFDVVQGFANFWPNLALELLSRADTTGK